MTTRGEMNVIPKELYIEWKLKNFFFVSKDSPEGCSSAFFYFGNETWHLIMTRVEDKDTHFSLYLVRNKHGPPINLKCTLGLIMANGSKARQSRHTQVFNQRWNKCGIQRFISKSELLEKRHELVPDDILTVFCSVCYPTSVEDASCTPRSPIAFQEYKVLRDYKELLHKKEDCDVIIYVKDQEFPAHSAILRARSPVFASTYKYDTKEKATGVINIEDLEPSSFSDFLYFLYCGDTDVISVENVFSLYTVSDKYDVEDLRVSCVEFMKENVTTDTFCDTIVLALNHSETELIFACADFFTKHALEIAKTVKWQRFSAKNSILSNKLFVKALAARGHNG